jgi:hypothetical protein
MTNEFLADPEVQRRYGVSAMTLWRWDHNPKLGFPKPLVINRRKYRRVSDLERWERSREAA